METKRLSLGNFFAREEQIESLRTDRQVTVAGIGESASIRRARGAAIRANLAFARGDSEQAIAALREAAAANLADPFLEATLAANQRHADALAAEGQLDEARRRYQLLIDIAPGREATRLGWQRLQPPQ